MLLWLLHWGTPTDASPEDGPWLKAQRRATHFLPVWLRESLASDGLLKCSLIARFCMISITLATELSAMEQTSLFRLAAFGAQTDARTNFEMF